VTAADIAVTPLSQADHRAKLRKAAVASTIGTTIEWYDFPLYSYRHPAGFRAPVLPAPIQLAPDRLVRGGVGSSVQRGLIA